VEQEPFLQRRERVDIGDRTAVGDDAIQFVLCEIGERKIGGV
jgi:hypothetical protein